MFITTSAAVAVSRAIETISNNKVKAQIKWVNDVYVDNKKVCGILTEAAVDFESGGLEYAVLGIGVNILAPESDFPDELKNVATSVFGNSRQVNIRNRLAAEILRELNRLPENFMDKEILNEYRSRSMLIGKMFLLFQAKKKNPASCWILTTKQDSLYALRTEVKKQFPQGK